MDVFSTTTEGLQIGLNNLYEMGVDSYSTLKQLCSEKAEHWAKGTNRITRIMENYPRLGVSYQLFIYYNKVVAIAIKLVVT